MSGIRLRSVPLDAPAATELLDELDDDLARRYGGGEGVRADAGDFRPPGGLFVVLEVDGQPAACGGYRRWQGPTAELKRMYVRPGFRGRGLARRVLRELEDAAAAAGYTELWLETGVPQHEAMALYTAAGYRPIPTFGQYAGAPDQRCYGKTLA